MNMAMRVLDTAALWSVVPAVLLLVVGCLGAGSQVLHGAAIALPIACAAAIPAAVGWRSTMGAALGGVLVGVIIRFAGLMVGGVLLARGDEPGHLTAIAALASALVVGLMIDAVIRSCPLAHEEPVRG
jgi:hypothetical protein